MKLKGMVPTECTGMQQARKTKLYQNDKKQKAKFVVPFQMGTNKLKFHVSGEKSGVQKQPRKLQ